MATFASDATSYDPRALAALRGGQGYSVDPRRCSILVHDLLPYYVDVLDEPTRNVVVEASDRIVSWGRAHRVPVIASAPRPAARILQRGLGGSLWGLGPSPAQVSESCLTGLAQEDVVWVRKRSLSAFYATDLEVELRRTRRDQLLIVGVFASQGIVATSFDALARDIECIVISDAVADYGPSLHRLAMHQIVRSTGQVIYTGDLPE